MGGLQEYLDGIDHEENTYSILIWQMEEHYSLLIDAIEDKICNQEKEKQIYINKNCINEHKSLRDCDNIEIEYMGELNRFDWLISDCYEALKKINKTTVIDAYHQWEKHWYNFLSSMNIDRNKIRSHSDLKKTIKIYKHLDENKLDYVNLLSNILKHGDDKKIIKLHQLRPNLFDGKNSSGTFGMKNITIKKEDVFESPFGNSRMSVSA